MPENSRPGTTLHKEISFPISIELKLLTASHDAGIVTDSGFRCLSMDLKKLRPLAAFLQPDNSFEKTLPQLHAALKKFESKPVAGYSKFELQFSDEATDLKVEARISRSPLSDNFLISFDEIDAPSQEPEMQKSEISRLQNAFEEYREIVENAAEVVFKLDGEGNLTYVSDEFERNLGFPKAAILGTHFEILIHSEDLEICQKAFNEIRSGEKSQNVLFRIRNSGGAFVWMNCSATFFFDENNNPKYCIGFAQDISHIKESLEALQESRRRYASFINESFEGIFRLEAEEPFDLEDDPEKMLALLMKNCYVAECNEIFAREFGAQNATEIIGLRLFQIIQPGNQSALELCRQLILSNYRIKDKELTRIGSDGNILYSLVTGIGQIAEGKFLGFWGALKDITQAKQIETSLLRNSQVMENISEAVISTDLSYNIISWNRSAEEYYGLKLEEVRGKNFRTIVPLNYLAGSRDAVLAELLRCGSYYGDAYFVKPDGEKRFLSLSISNLINKHGEKVGYAAVHKDITGTMKADEALKMSEQRHRSLVNALGEGIVMMDAGGEYLTHNKSLERIFGEGYFRYPTEGKFKTFYDETGSIVSRENLPIHITAKTGRSLKGIILGYDRPDSTRGWLSVNTEPIYYSTAKFEQPDAVVATLTDVTQQRAVNEELVARDRELKEYASRMASILDSITHGFIVVDQNLNVVLWNRTVEKVTEISFEEAKGKNVRELLAEYMDEHFLGNVELAGRDSRTLVTEIYSEKAGRWIEVSAYPSTEGGFFVYLRDISSRKHQEDLLKVEKEVLEFNADPEVSLKDTVSFFLNKLEPVFVNMSCCVVMQSDHRLSILPSPSFPMELKEDLESLEFSAEAFSGINLKQMSSFSLPDNDFAKRWPNLKDGFKRYGIRLCWTFPVLNNDSVLIATLLACFTEEDPEDKIAYTILERNSKLLGTIISGKLDKDNLKISNERYLLATQATNDAIYDWDMACGKLYWGEMFYSLFGYPNNKDDEAFSHWQQILHPDDRERVKHHLFEFLNSHQKARWQEEYRMRDYAGNYRIVQDRGFLIYNEKGEITRMVGAVQDITDRIALEKTILSQELEKQKHVAQAVVEAQEKERADIGKDLHDNVNQILSTARLYLELAKSDDRQRATLIERSAATILTAINEIRVLSRSLVPSSINDIGIIESVKDLVENIRFTEMLNVEFSYEDNIEEKLNQPLKLMLYRIVQEQVNNVLKHALAKNLVIYLGGLEDQGKVSLCVEDDGQGFDLNNIRPRKGVGLSNIKMRAELFNGSVKIESSPQKGCKLLVTVPIAK